MSKADLSKRPDEVAGMFDEVAARYDRTNLVTSAGNAVLWRIATARALDPQPGERILDVGAGTGTSSIGFARRGAHVVAADFSEGMIAEGRRRHGHDPRIEFVQADALDLPFESESFDAVTTSFALRNVEDPRRALTEFLRVLRPGGRVLVCEFSHPRHRLVRRAYHAYLRYGMPLAARLVSSSPDAYGYLMESIRDWPNQSSLAGLLRDAGFERVAYRDLTAGIVALHRGYAPGGL